MGKNMKTTVLATLLFSSTFAFANANYEKAVNSFQANNFESSYSNIQEYLKTNSINKDVAFILGRSAYEIGKFREAIKAYEEILKENPNNDRVKLELAQTYFQLKQYEKAREIYEDVLKNPTLPANVRKNIELTLNSLDSKSKRNFLSGTLGFGIGFDSNVNNISGDDVVNWIVPLKLDQDKKSDGFTEYLFSLKHNYKLSDNLLLENKFAAYYQKYFEETQNDLGFLVLGTGLSYYSENYKLSLGADYNHIWLDQKNYLDQFILAPSLDYKLTNNLMYKTKFRFIRKLFIEDDDKFRDSSFFDFENKLSLSTENFGTNSFGITFGTNDRIGEKHHNVDYNFISLKYDNLYPITTSTILLSGIEFYKDKYKEETVFPYSTKRDNKKWNFDLGVMHSLSKDLSLGATIRYTDNNSNQNIYEYDKVSLKANIYYSF